MGLNKYLTGNKSNEKQTVAESFAAAIVKERSAKPFAKNKRPRTESLFSEVERPTKKAKTGDEVVVEADLYIAPNVKLRIKDRTVSSEALNKAMETRTFKTFADLASIAAQSNESDFDLDSVLGGDWISIGVAGKMSEVRMAKNRADFSTVKVFDLQSAAMSVFLFDEALKSFQTIEPGSVVLFFNAEFQVSLNPKSNSTTFCLKVSKKTQIEVLGKAVHFGYCGYETDKGPCPAVINTCTEKRCVKHMDVLFGKSRSKRMALNDAFSARPPEVVQQKLANFVDYSSGGSFRVSSNQINPTLNENVSMDVDEDKPTPAPEKDFEPYKPEELAASTAPPNPKKLSGFGVSSRYALEAIGYHQETAEEKWRRVQRAMKTAMPSPDSVLKKGGGRSTSFIHPNSRLFYDNVDLSVIKSSRNKSDKNKDEKLSNTRTEQAKEAEVSESESNESGESSEGEIELVISDSSKLDPIVLDSPDINSRKKSSSQHKGNEPKDGEEGEDAQENEANLEEPESDELSPDMFGDSLAHGTIGHDAEVEAKESNPTDPMANSSVLSMVQVDNLLLNLTSDEKDSIIRQLFQEYPSQVSFLLRPRK